MFQIPGEDQWEFQDPKMEVSYHMRAYFLGISTYIGLIYGRYLQSIGSCCMAIEKMSQCMEKVNHGAIKALEKANQFSDVSPNGDVIRSFPGASASDSDSAPNTLQIGAK